MKNKKVLKLIIAAMFAALVSGLTLFPNIPIPGGGYIHAGDTMIYLAASFLPLPYAIATAVIGGCLADILSGYVAYVPFTIIAKALLTVAFTSKNEKILTKRNYFAPLAGLIITPAIYLGADAILYGVAGAVPGIIWNVCQAAASLFIYYIIGAAFDKMGLKSRLIGKIQ